MRLQFFDRCFSSFAQFSSVYFDSPLFSILASIGKMGWVTGNTYGVTGRNPPYI